MRSSSLIPRNKYLNLEATFPRHLTARLISKKIALEIPTEEKAGAILDWKEQLSTLLEELAISLDVRLICIKDKEKWFLKRLRAIVFYGGPICQDSLRAKIR